MATSIWVFDDPSNKLFDLVDRAELEFLGVSRNFDFIRIFPSHPLLAVHWAKLAVFVSPLIPNGDSLLVEVLGVGVTA